MNYRDLNALLKERNRDLEREGTILTEIIAAAMTIFAIALALLFFLSLGGPM